MNTPAHLIIGLSVFGRADARVVTAAALAGAMIPDLSLYLLAGTHLFVLGTPPEVVFGQMYFSSAWQSIFRIDNSMVLWGIGLVLALMARSGWATALCGAAMMHLVGDFLLHHDDGRAHFWPISTWIFQSPVSYWDGRHYGNIVGPAEAVLCIALCVMLWRRFTGVWMRVLIALLALAEAVPAIIFGIIFAG